MGAPETSVKKVYQPPILIRYGDLGQMTATRFKGTGQLDGKGSKAKT